MGYNKTGCAVDESRFTIAHNARLDRVMMRRVNPCRVIGKLKGNWYLSGRSNFLARNYGSGITRGKIKQHYIDYIVGMKHQVLPAINRTGNAGEYYWRRIRHFS